MASTSSFSLTPCFFRSTDFNDHDLTARNFLPSFGFKKNTNFKGNQLLVGKSFKLNCSVDREMDVSTSALVDGVAECLNEMEVREPSISTMVLNFENKFDPYEAMSTPLYQTATFKQ
ncbi:cystathionine beta-lyase, partial [Quercus suber]